VLEISTMIWKGPGISEKTKKRWGGTIDSTGKKFPRQTWAKSPAQNARRDEGIIEKRVAIPQDARKASVHFIYAETQRKSQGERKNVSGKGEETRNFAIRSFAWQRLERQQNGAENAQGKKAKRKGTTKNGKKD